MIKWKAGGFMGPIPKENKKRKGYSVVVFVYWTWDSGIPVRSTFEFNDKGAFRKACYSFEGKTWLVEGISGNVTVIAWTYINKPKFGPQ